MRWPSPSTQVSDCAQACATDTDADLSGEQNLADMVECIRLCLRIVLISAPPCARARG